MLNPFYIIIEHILTVNRAIFVVIAQIAGGMSASIVVKLILPGDEVLFNVKLAPGVSITQGFFIEMFLTFELVFTILMLAAEVNTLSSSHKLWLTTIQKTKATFVAPVGIGLALFIGHMVGAFWTGAGSNPARAFGPSVAALSFPSYHWLYCTDLTCLPYYLTNLLVGAGPFLGAIVAAAFYRLLKTLRYEDVNGDQDKSADEESLIEAQTNRIENAFKKWGSRSRESEFGLLGMNPPQRYRSPPEHLRLYRMSGLERFKQDGEHGYDMQYENNIEGVR
jgi:aquaporin related protein